jgi:hypothetical protein
MTQKDAVRQVLAWMTEGQQLTGWQIHQRVVRVLKANNERTMPLDATVLRRVRELAAEYHIHNIKGESLYMKQSQGMLFEEIQA